MKLLKHSRTGWRYGLEQREGILLRMLVEEFPLTVATAARITRTGDDPESVERERLLNEALAKHRQELKRKAGKLLADRLKAGNGGWRLSLNVVDREVLLQLLNDIRVESWHALDEPENLEAHPPKASKAALRHHQLMQLAGYFEWKILDSSGLGEETRC